VAVEIPETTTGLKVSTHEALPSWPEEFSPQHFTVESGSKAQAWYCPVETDEAKKVPVCPEPPWLPQPESKRVKDRSVVTS